MADQNSFIQTILSWVIGAGLPIIGPILVQILVPIIIKWIQDTFNKVQAGTESEGVDDMLSRLAGEAE